MANVISQEYGQSYVAMTAAATAVTTLGAGNPCALLGVYVPGALTAQIITFWTQTAGSVTGQYVVSTGTFAANAFYRIPAYFPKGITFKIIAENPACTILWNPAD